MARPAKPFASKIHFGPSCWEWIGYKDEDGYGKQRFEGKKHFAHRVAYMMFVGPIPEGMLVCHKCDNPACVRHDHLFLGTNADNMADCRAKNRHYLANVTHCPSGHEYTKENTIIKKKQRACRACNNKWDLERYYAKRKRLVTDITV